MKKIMILGAGIYQVPLIKTAKRMGLYTIVVSIPGNYPGFALADKVYYENTVDDEKILEIARAEQIDGIVTTGTDVCVITIGKVCDAMGLAGLSYKAAQIAVDKMLMKTKYEEYGVRTARFRQVLFTDPDIKKTIEGLEFPLIFKSVDSSGSRGITRVDSYEEFDSAMQYAPIAKLSGGEKRRLYLLKVLMEARNVLLLDEPSNDLDIPTLTILEDYLDHFDGIILIVSHDRYFLDRTVSRIFAFNGGGKIRQSEGGYSDYLIRVELEKPKDGQTIAENMSDAASAQTGESDSKKTWKQREKKLKFSYKEQREYETIDEDIAKLEEKIEKLDREMVKNATNSVKLSELMKEKEETETTLEEKMDRWVYLNDLAEQIENQ